MIKQAWLEIPRAMLDQRFHNGEGATNFVELVKLFLPRNEM
jgi:hypothetical protein